MMNADHYAVVIGLSSYPRLGDPPPADLKGPELDAQQVVKWLRDPNGGGLPQGNIRTILSRDFGSPPDPEPTRDKIQQAFRWLDDLAKKNQAQQKGRKVGQRLYLYASGHGFSPRFRQGCLLAADAAEDDFTANVFPTAWIEWFQDAAYFQEHVLWMDCCMDRQILVQPTAPPGTAIVVGGAPGPSFVAFAAPRPLKAVEKPIPADENRYHGIFTWNLIQGLRGAAANAFGIVTGQSLADWLRQAQMSWLDDKDRQNPDVAKEPDTVVYGNDIVFARGVTPALFDVTLRFPAKMKGSEASLWSGMPPQASRSFTVDEETKLRLPPGLYLAEVPEHRLRHGFAVTRSDSIALAETGQRVEANKGGPFALVVNPNDSTADIRLVGDGFRSVDGASGSVTSRLPVGVYQLRIRIGRQIVEKVILLDRDWDGTPPQPGTALTTDVLPPLPAITSAAPLPNTRASREYQREAAQQSRVRSDVTAGKGAELMVMTRCFTDSGSTGSLQPWKDVKVFYASGTLIADLAVAGTREASKDPVGVCTFSLAPGAYVLQYPAAGGVVVAQSLVLPPGNWRLEAYLLRTSGNDEPESRPRVSLLMRRAGSAWGTEEDVRLEKARVALADERLVLNDELSDLLLRKFENPLAGIIGGHLLLIDGERGGRMPPDLINTVVTNLRNLVGRDHPDVEALSLACTDATLRSTRPLSAAPLFERSWKLFVQASQKNPSLVPLAVWQQVHATVVAPPFLAWAAVPTVQRSFRRAMATAVFAQDQTSEESMLSIDSDAASASIADPLLQSMDLTVPSTRQSASASLEADETHANVTRSSAASRRRAHRALAMDLPPVAIQALLDEHDLDT